MTAAVPKTRQAAAERRHACGRSPGAPGPPGFARTRPARVPRNSPIHHLLPLLLLAALTSSAAAQREALEPWWNRAPEVRSRFYHIKSDLPPGETRYYARHLDRLYAQFMRKLGRLPARAPEKLNVYIFSTRAEYLLTLRVHRQIDASGTAGMFFIKPGGDGLAFFTAARSRPRILHTLQHEAFHQFAYSRFGADLPPWLNEGLAELFGQAVLIDNDLKLGLPSARLVDAVRGLIEAGEHVPLETMVAMGQPEWNERVQQNRAAPLYHQAWSMVHFLVYGNEARYQPMLERMLRLINHGSRFEHAFAEVFGRDLSAFEREWLAHVNALAASPFATALERIEFLAEGSHALRGERVYPTTLQELQEHLQELSFTCEAEVHGMRIELSAADAENFTIPRSPGSEGETPVFEVSRPDLNRMLRRERLVEEEVPSPSLIRTRGLEPRDLRVRWVREEEFGDFRYVVEFVE